jgi:hypothetical protein
MVFALGVQPANIIHCFLDFLTAQTVKLLGMRLELSIILKNVFFFFWLFGSVEHDNSSCMVADSQHIASVAEFHNADHVFSENLLSLALVAEHLAKFVIRPLAHSSILLLFYINKTTKVLKFQAQNFLKLLRILSLNYLLGIRF